MTLIQTFLLLESQVRGRSMSEGKIIFSIVTGLGFVQSQSHRCLRFLPVRLVLRLPRKQRILRSQ